MGRRRPTPELQKVKNMDGSPELMTAKTESLKKISIIEHQRPNPSRMVTRARGKRQLASSVGLIGAPEINDAPKPIDEGLQKASCVLTPKMFFGKSYEKGARKLTKLAENEPTCIPAVKKSKNSMIIIENKTKASNASSKQTLLRATRNKNKDHMTTEEVMKELTNDKAPRKCILLPVNKKHVANKVNLDEDVDKSAERFKMTKNRKQKTRLSLADIVKEIFPDSPEKKRPDRKVISNNVSRKEGSTTKLQSTKKDQPKKVSNDEWDHSLLLVTDDFNSSGNVYDFEEFQIDEKSSSAKKSSLRKSDKKQSIKKTAAMKAIFNGKIEVNKKLTYQKKIKKPNTKTTKTKTTKTKTTNTKRVKVVKKEVSPVVPVGNPVIEPEVSVESQEISVNNGCLSVSDNPFQTPTVQILKEPVSITELEKLKATKHIENKIISKVNKRVLSPDWPQLPDLPSQQFLKLKRGAMEGPTAADNLSENKPKSMLIKTYSPSDPSALDMSSVDTESTANKPKPVKAYFKLSEKLSSADHRPIDLFTYPVALPTKKPMTKIKKNGKCKEIKETPRNLMAFMYPTSAERYMGKPKEDATFKSPPPVMLPKFLHAETSTPVAMDNNCSPLPKFLDREPMSISPVKEFQSPSSMRTYEHKSRRSSSAFLDIIKNVEIFADDPKENFLQENKTKKPKAKKKDGHLKKTNKQFDEWASKLSSEFDEIEEFELSIEN